MNEDRKVQRGQMSVLGIPNLGGWGDTQVEVSGGELKFE